MSRNNNDGDAQNMIQERNLDLDEAIAQRLQENFDNEYAETLEEFETIAQCRPKRKNAGEDYISDGYIMLLYCMIILLYLFLFVYALEPNKYRV